MPLASIIVIAALVVEVSSAGQPRGDCADVKECRALALDAAAHQDYELFHDLAWRVLQKAPRNDPEAMTLVARAQSLSGRPLDALVMLNRLADINVAIDVDTSEDFRRVRTLSGWPELQARIEAIRAAGTAATGASAAKPSDARAAARKPDSAKPGKIAEPATETAPAARKPGSPAEVITGEPSEAVRFKASLLSPAGLAYDDVSNRFIVGSRGTNRLVVVGERSQNVSTLASAETAGFGDIAGLAIDRREGDLWVVSGGGAEAKLHKLQLISGRVLAAISAAETHPGRFVDVAVTAQSTVVALDDSGRLFRLRRLSMELEVSATSDIEGPVSVAVASEAVAYLAHKAGILRVDLASGAGRAVRAPESVDLTGLACLRPYGGNELIAIQATSKGLYRILRLRLDRSGTRVTSVALLDKDVPMAAPAVVVAGDLLYYLTGASLDSLDDSEAVVRRVKLR